MKCICGHAEEELRFEIKKSFYQSGKRKGQPKAQWHEEILPDKDSLFIRVRLEKDFTFETLSSDFYGCREEALLYACPKCGTIKLQGVGD